MAVVRDTVGTLARRTLVFRLSQPTRSTARSAQRQVWHLADERSFLPAAAQDAKDWADRAELSPSDCRLPIPQEEHVSSSGEEAIDTAAELRAKIHELDAKASVLVVHQDLLVTSFRCNLYQFLRRTQQTLFVLGSYMDAADTVRASVLHG